MKIITTALLTFLMPALLLGSQRGKDELVKMGYSVVSMASGHKENRKNVSYEWRQFTREDFPSAMVGVAKGYDFEEPIKLDEDERFVIESTSIKLPGDDNEPITFIHERREKEWVSVDILDYKAFYSYSKMGFMLEDGTKTKRAQYSKEYVIQLGRNRMFVQLVVEGDRDTEAYETIDQFASAIIAHLINLKDKNGNSE